MSVKLEIIENFLSESDLRELQSVKLKKTDYKEMNVYVKKIKDNFIAEMELKKKVSDDYIKIIIH